MRNHSKTEKFINSLEQQIKEGRTVAVAGITSPDKIANKLKQKGIKVTSIPMHSTSPRRYIYDWWEEIIGIEEPITTLNGYLFHK